MCGDCSASPGRTPRPRSLSARSPAGGSLALTGQARGHRWPWLSQEEFRCTSEVTAVRLCLSHLKAIENLRCWQPLAPLSDGLRFQCGEAHLAGTSVPFSVGPADHERKGRDRLRSGCLSGNVCPSVHVLSPVSTCSETPRGPGWEGRGVSWGPRDHLSAGLCRCPRLAEAAPALGAGTWPARPPESPWRVGAVPSPSSPPRSGPLPSTDRHFSARSLLLWRNVCAVASSLRVSAMSTPGTLGRRFSFTQCGSEAQDTAVS